MEKVEAINPQIAWPARVYWQASPTPEDGPDAHGLSTEDARALIRELSESPGRPELVIFGGDPLEREDIYDLVEMADRLGVQVTVRLPEDASTTDVQIRRLARAGVRRVALRLESHEGPVHDEIIDSKGAFERTMRLMADARAWWVPVELETRLCRRNAGEVDRMADALARLEFETWVLEVLVPESHAERRESLKPSQYDAIFEQIWLNTLYQPYAIEVSEAPHFRRYVLAREGRPNIPARSPAWARFRRSLKPINDGSGVAYVGLDGTIYPGEHLRIACGHFPEDALLEVYRDHPLFVDLRDPSKLTGKCGACDYREECGGSRARAYTINGDPLAADPDCAYVPEGFTGKVPVSA